MMASRTSTLSGFSSFSKYLDSKNLKPAKKIVTKNDTMKMFSIILNKNVKRFYLERKLHQFLHAIQHEIIG
jgi:hypothetical protein